MISVRRFEVVLRRRRLGRVCVLVVVVAALAVLVAVPFAQPGAPEAAELTPAQRERLGGLGGQRSQEAGPLTPAQAHRFLEGLSALHHDRPEDALARLAPLVERDGRDDEWVLNAYGAALLEAGRPEQASEVLGHALDRYPRNGYLHLNLAWARLALERPVEATPHFDSFLASDVAQHDEQMRRRAYLALSRAHARTGRIEEREVVLQSALNDIPNDAWFAELLAEAAFERGDDDEFRRLSQQAVRSYEALAGDEFEAVARGSYQLPVAGPVLVRRGFDSDPGHRGLRMRHAVELWPLDEADDLRPRPDGVPMQGSPVSQWHGYATPVLAARAGTIVLAEDRHPDRTHTGLPEGLPHHPYNHLVLHHKVNDNSNQNNNSEGEVSVYRYLQQHSIRNLGLAVGDTVEAGQPIGKIGCNGTRTAFPQLTFYVGRYANDDLYPGLAFTFARVEQQHADYQWHNAPSHTPKAGDTLRPAQ